MRLSFAAIFALSLRAQQIDAPTSSYLEVVRAADGSFFTIEATQATGRATTPGVVQPQHGGGTCIFGIRPPQSGPCPDIYIRKLAADGQTELAATYFGGDREETTPSVLLSPDGSLILSFLSGSASIAGGLNSSFSNHAVVLRLSPDLNRVEAIRRLPQNSSLRAFTRSATELFVAGTEYREPNRYTIFVEALDLKSLALRRSFEYETSFGVRVFSLLLRSGGDLVLSWLAQLDGPRVMAIDPYTGQRKWSTQLAAANGIKAIGLLPGDGVVAFLNGTGAGGRAQSFLQRLSPEGQLLEKPLITGSFINFARTTPEGILEWIGASANRGSLRTSGNAPFRCRPSFQSQYYGRMNYAQGEPDFVSYLSLEAQSAHVSGVFEGFPLARAGSKVFPYDLPEPVIESSLPCLEGQVENYAIALGRSRSTRFDPTDGRTAAPGEFLTIYGAGISDGEAIFRPEETGALPTEVAGTRVLVDGAPVGIIELMPTRVTIALPFELANREKISIALERDGAISPPIELNVVRSKLHIFSELIEGVGLAGVYKNGRLVTEQNPAEPGDEVAVYVNTVGLLDRNLDADKVVNSERLPKPLAEVGAFVEGSGGQVVVFAGAVRGQLPGLIQVNVRIAPDLKYVGRLSLRIMVGSDYANTDFWLRQP